MQKPNRGLIGVLAVCLLTVSNWTLYAQSTYGTITGTVSDPSGAAIVAAKVEATNQDTNDIRSTTTDSQGIYVFPNLIPGHYTVAVTTENFSSAKNENITLLARITATSNVQMQVAGKTATVEVSAPRR